jgi:hypothetical protein
MTFQHSVGVEGLRIKFVGDLTHEDVVDCCVTVAADPHCRESCCAVIDLSDTQACRCPRPDLALLAAASRSLMDDDAARSRVFVLVPDDAQRHASLEALLRGVHVEFCCSDAELRDRLQALAAAH